MAKIKLTPKDNVIENINENTVEDMIFSNVEKLNDEEYSLIINGYELATMWDEQKIHFYGDIQRGLKPKKINRAGDIKYVPICSDKNIKDIYELIVSKDDTKHFYTSQLTVTVIKTGNEHIEYNEENRTLNVTGTPLILDGNHRIRALHRVYLASKILDDDSLIDKLKELKFPVKITHYDTTTAKIVFNQFAKGLKISTSKAESFDMTKASNRIVDKLNKQSVLKDMIDTNRTVISKSDEKHIYTFASVNEAIKNSFGVIQNEKEENEIYDFLALFFKELTTMFPEMMNYELRTVSKEYSLVCENMMIYGYLALAENLYLKRYSDKWREEFKFIENMNFDKESEIWQPIVRIYDDKISLVNNKQTRSIMRKIIKEEFYKVQNN